MALAVSARAQQKTVDSLRTVRSDSVNVLAVREANISSLDAQSVTTESMDRLVRHAGSPLASSALRSVGSSLNVRRYGPLGASSFISFRGLPAEYSSVYRDGIRIPSEQNSLTDLGQLLLFDVDRVELIPAAESIILGGDAIGAAINLVSRDRDSATLRLTNSLTSYGSHEPVSEMLTNASLSGTPGATVFALAGVTIANATGRYPFTQHDWPSPVVRALDDAHTVAEYASASWLASDNDQVRVHLDHFAIERGLPGPASIPGYGASLSDTRQADEQTFTSASYSHSGVLGSFTLASGYQHQFESYTRPAIAVRDTARTDLETGILHWRNRYDVLDIFAGVEYERSQLAGTTNALPSGDSIVTRNRVSGYLAASRPLLGLNLSAAIRAERFSDIGSTNFLPQLAATAALWRDLSLHVAYGRAFHPPTFNELYWATEGGLPNPDLRPERGESWTARLRSPVAVGPVAADISAAYFHTTVVDEILWLPSGSNTYMAYNLGPIVTNGAEIQLLAAASLFGFDLSAQESYTLLDARVRTTKFYGNEVPFSTPSASLFTLDASRESFGHLSFSAHYAGHRYTDPGNDEKGSLPPTTTFDLGYEAPPLAIASATITLRVNAVNFTDVQRSEFPGYPLPGRTLIFTASLNY
jgi:vitamin B12 transporter